MTRRTLLDRIIAEHKRTGRKPRRIELSEVDYRELEADMPAPRCCCPCHRPRGRVLTFVGVDIYVKGETE